MRDLIVIGGSAGGVEALATLVAGLPPDLPAAVCVVVHMRPYGTSHLAEVLARSGPLPAVAAQHGAPLLRGVIHVAVPDMHLLVERDDDLGVLRLARGPHENRNRPSIDPLFRSAALAFGERVIAVVLSGALDDGTAGLWTVKDRGGLAVVQDPDDALVSSMPRSAIEQVGADHVAVSSELGALLGRLVREAAPRAAPPEDDVVELVREVAMAEVDDPTHERDERYGVPSRFACPDCGGVLWDVSREGPLRFRCETGHAYSPASLAEEQTEAVEGALWAALRAIEDKIALARARRAQAEARGLTSFAERFTVEEEASLQHGSVLRALLRLDGRTGVRPHADAPDDPSEGGAAA